jgi:DNA-binding XRE family transcriptional regulator
MAIKTDLRSSEAVREEQLEHDPDFREYWKRTAVARAVAHSVIGYRVEHRLTQTKFGRRLGVSQPQVARLETGEHTPSLEMLQRLSRTLGLRFILEVTPVGGEADEMPLTLPSGMEIVEDVTTNGSRVRVATG